MKWTFTDTQRLDWLIKQGHPGVVEGIGLNEAAWESAMNFVGKIDDQTDKSCVRAAIDGCIIAENIEHGEKHHE